MFRKNHRQHKKLHNQAYLAFDAGDLQTAADKFAELAKVHPDNAQYRYMLGLAAKYRMDWALSLQANLAAIACAPEFDEAAHWNAAIAATALHDWQTARQLWAACGIPLPEGEGEIETDFGTAVLRLNPWADGECVYARRIDPCRSRIINVPLPESGYRMGDIILHDASTGRRADGQGSEVLVFNALERWRQSPRQTYPLSYNARLKPIRTHCPNNRCTPTPTPKIGQAASASSACAAAMARRTITNITHLPNRAHGRPSAASASPPEVWPTHKRCWTTGRHRQTAGRFGKSSRRITPCLGIPKAASGGKTTMKTTNRHAKRRGIPPAA